MTLYIRRSEDIGTHLRTIEGSMRCVVQKICNLSTPAEAFRRMKFDKIGQHPIEGHKLNLVEQINQTFTYRVALSAVAQLLDRHPEADGFKLAPGAEAELPYDIVSIAPGIVCAETFAAVHPNNNRKLAKDLQKLEAAQYRFRYIFFYSPNFPEGRVQHLERSPSIEVHCVGL